MLTIRNQKDFCAGLMFAAIGGGAAYVARDYTIGTSTRIGPGYFPFGLGVLLCALGIVIALRTLGGKPDRFGRIGEIAWRPLTFVILANVLFGVLLGGVRAIGLPPMGLMVAGVAAVVTAALAGDEFRLREAVPLAIGLAIFSYVVFAVLLGSPIDMLPPFLNRW